MTPRRSLLLPDSDILEEAGQIQLIACRRVQTQMKDDDLEVCFSILEIRRKKSIMLIILKLICEKKLVDILPRLDSS